MTIEFDFTNVAKHSMTIIIRILQYNVLQL